LIGPTLETARLILRPPARRDLDAWADFLADEEAALFVGGAQSRSGARRFMAATAESWTLKGFGMFSVIEKAGGRWIGRVGPLEPEGWPGPEVGWGLAREAWGRGLATEAAAAAMDWAFDALEWPQIIHCIHPENVASARLARRLGSARLSSARLPAPFDSEEVDIWGQSREDWRRRRGGR
jgi:RimJ/RimL family protein N-acetyltransferase